MPSNMMEVGHSLDCPESSHSYINDVPTEAALGSFPNPFNPTSTLEYALPSSGHINLSIFDITGRQVQTLIDQVMPRGQYQYTFDGSRLPSGVYFARLMGNGFSKTQKLVLLK